MDATVLRALMCEPSATIPDLGRALSAHLNEWNDDEALALLHGSAAGTPLEERLAVIAPEMLLAVLRSGAGLAASRQSKAVEAWIAANPARWSNILSPDARTWSRIVVSLGGAQADIAAASARQDRTTAQRLYDEMMAAAGATLAIGTWMEHRTVYSTDSYRSALVPGVRRDHHLGYDLFAPALTPLYMPMQGTVVQCGIIDKRLDYGGFLVTRHEIASDAAFFALWGHMAHESTRRWAVGDEVPQGTEFALIGDFEENGWWLPHLHFQLSALPFADFTMMPGVGELACKELWSEIFPDPARLILGA